MRIERQSAEAFRIEDAPGLDPITVVIQDYGSGRGQIIIACYGLSWVNYWGAMGDDTTVREFFLGCGTDYIANRMWVSHERRVKHRYAYLVKIIEAVKEALKELKP